MTEIKTHTELETASASEAWLELVLQKVEALRFGSVHITVHDGRVTQIESVEKTRINSGQTKPTES